MPNHKNQNILRWQQTLLKFDLQSARSVRLNSNKFALIFYNKFIENNIWCYCPGENTAVLLQLFPIKATVQTSICTIYAKQTRQI